jgi:hypothetical protein
MVLPSVAEAQELTSVAPQVLSRLGRAEQLLHPIDEREERTWLQTASSRVSEHLQRTLLAFEHAVLLPELRAARTLRADALLQRWVDVLQELEARVVAHTGPGHPLLEALFPHRNFEKVRRGSTHTHVFRVELERRRSSAYVRRLAADPDYVFLGPLLAEADGAYAALKALIDAPLLTELEEQALREAIRSRAATLELSLRQARALSEAVVAARPDLLTELGLDTKPRRAPRSRAIEAE